MSPRDLEGMPCGSDASLSAGSGSDRSAGARRRERRNMAATLLNELACIKEQNITLHGQVAQILQLLAVPQHGWPYIGHINPFLAWCAMAPMPGAGSCEDANVEEPAVISAGVEQTPKHPEPEGEESPSKIDPSPTVEYLDGFSCGKCLDEFYDVIVNDIAVQTEPEPDCGIIAAAFPWGSCPFDARNRTSDVIVGALTRSMAVKCNVDFVDWGILSMLGPLPGSSKARKRFREKVSNENMHEQKKIGAIQQKDALEGEDEQKDKVEGENVQDDELDEAVVRLMDSLVDAFCSGPVNYARVKGALLLFLQARVSQGETRAAALEEGKQYIRDCSEAMKLATNEMVKDHDSDGDAAADAQG